MWVPVSIRVWVRVWVRVRVGACVVHVCVGVPMLSRVCECVGACVWVRV